VTGTFFLKRSSGPLPLRYLGVWFTDNPICFLVVHRQSVQGVAPLPRGATFQLHFVALVAPLVCFCCSLHSTPSITWHVYYRLGVFNILKLSRNPDDDARKIRNAKYTIQQPVAPALVAQWRKSLAAVRLACVAAMLLRSGFNSRSGGLSGQQSAYSEINISGKHRGFNSVLFNLWPLANAGFRDAPY